MKELVSADYMERNKQQHASKRLPSRRAALVFGAEKPRSIGEAIANQLVDDGYNVVTPSRLRCDIRNPAAVESFMHQHVDADVLVLSQGATWMDWIEDQLADEVDRVIETNLTGSIYATNAFVDATIERPWKKQIVFIGSMAYRSVLNASAPYCASKAGLAHFARCAAWELAPKGYDVYTIHPSNTEGTPMTQETIEGIRRYRDLSREEAEQYWGAVLPREYWLQPTEIAELVSYLVSGRSPYLSGAQLEMGGGQR